MKKKEPRYLIRNITYGDKEFVDCMKEVIRLKLAEAEMELMNKKQLDENMHSRGEV